MCLLNIGISLLLIFPEIVLSGRPQRHVSLLHTQGNFEAYEDRGYNYDVISMMGDLVTSSDSQAVKYYTYPNIEEDGTSHFLGECGILDYFLKFGDESDLKLLKMKELLTVNVPIKLYNLTINFDTVRVKSVKEEFDDGLKISFPRVISLTVVLVVHQLGSVCERDVFDVKFDSFDVEVNVFDDIKLYFKGISLDMWHKIMLQIKRMIETHALYVFRKGFRSLGADFGRELCTVS